ncbi:MAG TPA: hypothetical protein VHB47_11455 [Thermoanaerobaculia bacterium]|nr:hypothetical protein [Thermoanaerobaculia bacterium]
MWLLVLLLPRPSRGLAWIQNATPRGGIITALALSGSSPSILYAGTVSAGVFVSSDGGTTWIPRLGGLPAGTVDFLAGDPLRAERAVASVSVGGEDFVFHTEDRGASWSGIPGTQKLALVLNALVVDPAHPALVYAATFCGVFMWQEGSSEWQPVGFANSDVVSLAIDPRGGAIYASVEDPDTGVFHIWKNEKGRGWSVLPLFVDCECGGQLVTDPARPNTLYLAGLPANVPTNAILKSGDGGQSWTPITAPPFFAGALFAAPGGVLYAATGGGVFRSADGGRSWLPRLTSTMSEAPPYDWAITLVVSPAKVSTLYLASDEGVWKTTNGGETWERSSHGIAAQPVYSLAVANDRESTVYASLESGLFRSRDGGETWRRTNLRGALQPYNFLSVAPSDPQRLYGDGLRSDDGGKTWRQVYFIGFDCYALDSQAVDPQDENVLYLGGYDCVGDGHDAEAFLVRTEDGGTTWTDITGSFSDGTYFEPAALAIDPQHPRTLYALAHSSLTQTAGNGFFKSLDAGATWDQVGSGLPLQWPEYYPITFALAVDADHPEVVYVGLPGLGVWTSSDGGASFSAMNCGFPTGLVGSILVTPASDAPLYAGLPGLGVWAWNAGTQCWTPLNSGLPAGDFTGAIVFSAHGEGVLQAGTGGNGLWRLDLP